jgi:hypothetical protein
LNKFQKAFWNFIWPLPDPKIALRDKFWTPYRKYLLSNQMEIIISIIVEEAKFSRDLGLFLRPEDLDREIGFWLDLLSLYGGTEKIREQTTYVEILPIITEEMDAEFDELSRYYFDLISNSKPKPTSSNNAFRCHLEAVRSHVLRDLYSGKIPLIPS